MRTIPGPGAPPRGISRREFARSAALAAAAVAVIPAEVLPRPAAPAGPLPAAPEQAAAESKKLSPESQAEVESNYQAILRQYGTRLSDSQKKDIHRLLTEGQPGVEKLRAFPLENGDGPATVFIPQRGPAGPGATSHSAAPGTKLRPKRAPRRKG